MKIRRSARTILATLSILSVFTLVTIWHNKSPETISKQDKQVLIKELSLEAPDLLPFLGDLDLSEEPPGFYMMGKKSHAPMPESILQASYSDPLACSAQPHGTDVLIRYRSIEDFLILVKEMEEQSPGVLATIDFQNYQIIPEPAVALSFRLLFSFGLAVVGLMIVHSINRK